VDIPGVDAHDPRLERLRFLFAHSRDEGRASGINSRFIKAFCAVVSTKRHRTRRHVHRRGEGALKRFRASRRSSGGSMIGMRFGFELSRDAKSLRVSG
jgi:hypothetical protein